MRISPCCGNDQNTILQDLSLNTASDLLTSPFIHRNVHKYVSIQYICLYNMYRRVHTYILHTCAAEVNNRLQHSLFA